MKVILNVDVKSLGEEGDVKNVANGYALTSSFQETLLYLTTKQLF